MHKIIISQKAKADIKDYALYLKKTSRNILVAKNWTRQLYELINALQEMPLCYAEIAEAEILGLSLRSFRHYSHRVIYGVDEAEKLVTIYRVYHGTRQDLQQKDIS